MSRAVSHLNPSVDSVTIRTQQAQIAFVVRPVFEAIIPGPWPSSFFAAINMVNIQDPVVAFAALNADAAEFVHKRQFSAPVARVLMKSMAVLIPMVSAAFVRAKSMLAIYSTSFASGLPFPSGGKITVLPAILPSSVFEAVEMHFKLLLAVSASHCDRCLFHVQNILRRSPKVKFDIACKRIEDAQRQGQLFGEAA